MRGAENATALATASKSDSDSIQERAENVRVRNVDAYAKLARRAFAQAVPPTAVGGDEATGVQQVTLPAHATAAIEAAGGTWRAERFLCRVDVGGEGAEAETAVGDSLVLFFSVGRGFYSLGWAAPREAHEAAPEILTDFAASMVIAKKE